MAWVTITSDDVKTRLAGAELTALQTAAKSAGQADPLPEIVTATVDEARGYIASNQANTLGAGETVPGKLVSCCLAIIRYRLATRLPVRGLLTPQREQEYKDAIRLLERVADGKFAIEEPETEDTELLSGSSPSIEAPTRNFSSDNQDGI